ncbi:MAG TPA: hypothetical protein VNP96_07730 [Solirubrobacterales bacterium]|nr:hypothetical protein [Solirubrobacterales bacterium]
MVAARPTAWPASLAVCSTACLAASTRAVPLDLLGELCDLGLDELFDLLLDERFDLFVEPRDRAWVFLEPPERFDEARVLA